MNELFDSILSLFGVSRGTFLENIADFTPTLLGVAVIYVLWLIFYVVISRVTIKALSKTPMRPALIEIVVNSIFKWTTLIIATIMALGQLGINVTAALAGVGIAGIAIGFAAKETLANVLSGFSIFIDDLYRRGDWVEIAGKYGQVKNITLRTTKIRNLDNIFIIIPNSEVTMHPVTNFSEEGMVRFSVDVSIGYKESIAKAREVLLQSVSAIEGVRAEPSPEVVADKLADSGVTLKVRIWVDDPGTDQKFKFLLNETCKQALDEAGIEIPYPQRDVHMK